MNRKEPLALFFQKLKNEGFRGILVALKWKFFRYKNMIVAVRDVSIPMKDVPRHRCEGIYFRLASLNDLDIMCANFPDKRSWYRKRLETPGYFCDLALFDEEVVAHNWFCTCPHQDPEMRAWIRPGEGQAYWFEGWCREDWRNRGVSNFGIKHSFEELFPSMNIHSVMTLLEEDNLPTRRLHKRYHFADIARQRHFRLGRLYFNTKPKPVKVEEG